MKVGNFVEGALSEEERGEGLRNKHSYSKLNTAARCLRKFYYRYVLGFKEQQEFLIRGRAVHAGQEYDNREKLLGHILLPKVVLEAAVAAFEQEGKSVEKALDKDGFIKEHAAQLEAYDASGERSKVKPIEGTIEAPFEIKLELPGQEGAVVGGFLDLLSYGPTPEDRHEVVDYKAAKRPVKEREANKSFQFDLYRLASFEGPIKVVNFVSGGRQRAGAQVTVGKGGGEVQRQRTLTWVHGVITAIRGALKTGDFPRCAPECFWCAPSACEFYKRCYPEKSAKLDQLVKIGEITKVGMMPAPEWRNRDRRDRTRPGNVEGSVVSDYAGGGASDDSKKSSVPDNSTKDGSN